MNAAKKIPFGELNFVTARCASEGESRIALEDLMRFEAEWRKDTTVTVRRFRRHVRAGGTSLVVIMIVVRRKPLKLKDLTGGAEPELGES